MHFGMNSNYAIILIVGSNKLAAHMTTVSNYIKDFIDLLCDSSKSGLALQLFPMVILTKQV